MAQKKYLNDASHPSSCPSTSCPVCRAATEPVPEEVPTVKCCNYTSNGERVDVYAPLITANLMAGNQGAPQRGKSRRTTKVVTLKPTSVTSRKKAAPKEKPTRTRPAIKSVTPTASKRTDVRKKTASKARRDRPSNERKTAAKTPGRKTPRAPRG